MARELEGGAYLPLVALLVLVDPGADRDLEAELGRDRRYQLGAPGRRIGPNRPGKGRNGFEVGANLLDRRSVAKIGVL